MSKSRKSPPKRQLHIETLRQNLLSRRDAIRAALRGDLSSLGGAELDSGDIGDIASGSQTRDLSSRRIESESNELTKIEEALTRLGAGEFGDCADCSSPIPLPRLSALPYATLCIDCQVKFEKTSVAH
ncbi:MAG: hypothetical protein Aurels2KO_33750 [Aureliella sp.]